MASFQDILSQGRFFLVDKPYTWTSFQVVKKLQIAIRKKSNVKKFKIGHAGTLDPLATGLLIVCLGKYTKKITEFQSMDKEYIGSIHLGATTASFDKEHPEDKTFPIEHINDELIKKVAMSFVGEQDQMPPTYSAIKIGGKRAFSYARGEEQVEIKSKHVNIYEFEITKIEMPEVFFRISCSKGTYIRSIARDFGERISSGAYLSSLRRTRIGNYRVEEALSPYELVKEIEGSEEYHNIVPE